MMPEIKKSKAERRAHYLNVRRRIAEKQGLDRRIAGHLLNWTVFQQAGTVLTYVGKEDEIDTLRLIQAALDAKKTVAVPFCETNRGDMDFYRIQSIEELHTGRFGILEPDPVNSMRVTRFADAVCIVPGLAFDRRGGRLGYGKGYYDRFLQKHRLYRVGLCYESLLADELLLEQHDIRMHAIITEKGLLLCPYARKEKKMDENQRNRNRGEQGAARRNVPQHGSTGNFKLDLRDEDIATGSIDAPKRREQPPVPYQTGAEGMSSKKIYYTEKERRQEKKEHKKRNKIKAGKNKRVFTLVWLLMVLLVSFTLASYLIGGAYDFLAKDRQEGAVEFDIPAQVTSRQLAQILYDNGAINKPGFFEIYCDLTAKKKLEYIQKATYKLERNLDYEDIINQLMEGEDSREVVTVTFPEGLNAYGVADLLEEYEVCSREEALAAMNEMDFSAYEAISEINNAEGKYYKLEGYLYPDTFEFYKGEEIKSVFGKMLNNFQNKTSFLNEQIREADMTKDQLIILASIIQREAANVDDMYKISAILHNRMNWGAEYGIYRLECDSTMFYPYKTYEDLPDNMKDYSSNYNTYQIEGLPAGAICNPGVDAIKAALAPSPDASEYLYFCHAEDGTAYYARTAEEHEQNKVSAGLAEW